MISARNKWVFPQVDRPDLIEEFTEAFGISDLVAKILIARGYDDLEKAHTFLQPDESQFHDPFALHDMDKAITRILAAIDAGEKIVVYGDYDVDGMTATAIMTWALEVLGAEVSYFVPDRFNDGYGPNLKQYQRLVDEGMQLLITVDNGVSGFEEIAWLTEQKIDVVVTDHHELPEQLPLATAIVHPRHPEGAYPFGGLSGAGVAFKVASALLEAPADEVLDLAAIGTIADVMDLTDENRTITALGLENLRSDPRPALAALLQKAGIDLSKLDAATVGFTIGPRLNSLGRLANANDGVQFLLMDEPGEAETMAGQLEELNTKRQALVNTISTEALAQAANFADEPVLVLTGEGWHEGVLGIVAAKVVEQTGKPTLVLNLQGQELKGSARSTAAFDLFAALDPHRDLMLAFGGHAAAAGLTLMVDKVPALRMALNQAAESQGVASAALPELRIAAEIGGRAFNRENYEALKALAPFGQGNPEPLFAVNLTGVENVKTMSAGKHLRFTGQTRDAKLPIVAFGRGSMADELAGRFLELQVVGTMSENTFRGEVTYQMMLADLNATGSAFLDWRTTRLTVQTFNQNASYIFFQKKMYEQAGKYVQAGSEALWWEDAFNKTALDTMALVDLPDSLEQLAEVLQFVPAKRLAAIFYSKQPRYLQQAPNRQDFSRFYKFVSGHPNFAFKAQYDNLAKYLNIERNTLTLIIQVFLEAKFVTIDNGFLNGVSNPASVKLEEMPAYRKFLDQRQLEQQLIYSTTAELEQLIADLSKQEN
ncbi:recombination protein J [Weissella oryzae SG25]|uniref:Single-stranded-DNA-specific exonuclease RecJ n=1 Tax=Weissella oryzae (strain DSM 25784 / JCM 18191 / LMG 30913 / SG25) TaxID=1329250 RepID=A0A069CSJ8_WEIOS|nr:single-stranded-DNA-specific exonuclease RecJ [Weissella oryzae]GAK30454.1 recombination protein J [Weissella oryzae SG25]